LSGHSLYKSKFHERSLRLFGFDLSGNMARIMDVLAVEALARWFQLGAALVPDAREKSAMRDARYLQNEAPLSWKGTT
jgi:hypothetical protein